MRLAAGIPADWAEAGSPRLPAGDRAAYANLQTFNTHIHTRQHTHTYTQTGTGRHMAARGRGMEGARGISDGATNQKRCCNLLCSISRAVCVRVRWCWYCGFVRAPARAWPQNLSTLHAELKARHTRAASRAIRRADAAGAASAVCRRRRFRITNNARTERRCPVTLATRRCATPATRRAAVPRVGCCHLPLPTPVPTPAAPRRAAASFENIASAAASGRAAGRASG